MKCASVLVIGDDLEASLAKSQQSIRTALNTSPDIVVLFCSGTLVDAVAEQTTRIKETFGAQVLIGCSADSLIGTREEVEQQSAISVWAASWPDATMIPFQLEIVRSADGIAISGWPGEQTDPPQQGDFGIVFADPFSFAADVLLDRFAEDRPEVMMIGGLASRGYSPGNNRLFLNEECFHQGAIGVLVRGGVTLTPVLSQGCRPIGRSLIVTKAERNEVFELGGKPALECLQEIFEELPASEKRLVQQGLLVGRVIDEYQESFRMGDFLVRGVVGIDEERKSIAVGDYFRPGQTVQFHIRDQQSAHQELCQLLDQNTPTKPPVGGLLFSCNGRGTQLFEGAHHDASCVADTHGDIPLAGFLPPGKSVRSGGGVSCTDSLRVLPSFLPLTHKLGGSFRVGPRRRPASKAPLRHDSCRLTTEGNSQLRTPSNC